MDTMLYAALALGAVLRLTRLAVDDSLTEPMRTMFTRRAGTAGGRGRPLWRFLELVTGCQWCSSVWIAFGALAPVYAVQGYPWWTYPFAALSIAYAAGILYSWLDTPPPARVMVHHLATDARVTVRTPEEPDTAVPGQSAPAAGK